MFFVGGLQYKLACIQSDKCHSADFSLITPNLYQSESKIICLISQRIKLLLSSETLTFLTFFFHILFQRFSKIYLKWVYACQIVHSNNSEIIGLRITLPKIEAKMPLKFWHSETTFRS